MKATSTLLVFLFLAHWGAYSQNFWQPTEESKILPNPAKKRLVLANEYKMFRLNVSAFKIFARSVPMETADRSFSAQNSDVEMDFPLPNGTFARFRIAKTPVLHPELAAQFPEIQTFEGYRVGGYGYVRFDFTHQGFHALIFTEDGQIYIDPYRQNDQENATTKGILFQIKK